MSFGWSIVRDSGYLASLKKPFVPPNVVSGSLVYVAGYDANSYNGAGSSWNDLSGNSNNMTISNATWSSVDKAFSFNKIIFVNTNFNITFVNQKCNITA